MNLRSSTCITSAPYPLPDDRAADRIRVSRAYLGREPVAVRNPATGLVFWVESEPPDWREFFEQMDADEAARRARKLH